MFHQRSTTNPTEQLAISLGHADISAALIHILAGDTYDQIRGAYWSGQFALAGANLLVRENVRITGAHNISVGENVLIEEGVTIYADLGPLKIGSNSLIRKGSVIIIGSEQGKGVTLGEWCQVGFYSTLNAGYGLLLGNYVIIGPNVQMNNYNHCYERTDVPIRFQGGYGRQTTVGDDCWIGTGAIILGTTLGQGCVVGAGALVNRDFPEFSVLAGVPAKIIKNRGVSQT